MKAGHASVRWLLAMCCCLGLVSVLWAQRPGNGYQRTNGNQQNKKGKDEVKLPDDKRLLELHKRFVLDAEKLAGEYERDNQLDKARTCYEEILRLVPNYPTAVEGVEKIRGRQYSAEKKIVEVFANKPWQDSGVIVSEGKPIQIRADGSWTFRMTHELNADGIEIPKELQDFDLGSLVGVIDDGNPKEMKPFLIGTQHEFTAPKTGRLLLRMYDADPTDNQGKLSVTIAGTFYHPAKK